ncbi:MAG TPA: DUF992 domain-containing protein [Acetobacteraceae bacterium]|nr:DUF992 domain-containing protein [Acetobacteraceae bacterium]
MAINNLVPVAALALMTAIAGTPAMAQSYAAPSAVKAGYLNCDEASGWGLVFGSSRALKCTYTSNTGHTERYTGHITKFGVDVGYVSGGVIVWAVLAPTSEVGRGALAGTYVGVTAGATVGGGVGANVLVGGSNKSISLQPISIEGTTGLNLAAGFGGIQLKPS